MSIRKKGARKIDVDCEVYLWAVKNNAEDKSLSIQKEDSSKVFSCTYSEWHNADISHFAITPEMVEQHIQQLKKDHFWT